MSTRVACSLSQTWVVPAVAALAAAVGLRAPALGAGDARVEDRTLRINAPTREAIERALEYLAARQQPDGSFAGERGRNTGVVSFAVLSFVATGNLPERGRHGQTVSRGIDYVLSHAQMNGLISNPVDSAHGPMYEHAMSTLMLAEMWGTTHRPGMLDTLQRATDLIISSQNDQGGWRYQPRPMDADVSVTVMQLVALRAARNAGIRVPRQTFENAINYVKSCAMPSGGFAYQPGHEQGVNYPRTGAGCTSLLVSGDYDAVEVREGIRFLQERKSPDLRGSEYMYYGLYYAAQAMSLAPDPAQWSQWYPVIRDDLLSRQQADGRWQGEAGSIYGTAMAVLTLSVPYRYLPIYQH